MGLSDDDPALEPGLNLLNDGEAREAIIAFNKILESIPTHAGALKAKTLALASIQLNKAALEILDLLVDLNPEDIEVWTTQGSLFHLEGMHQEALDSYLQALTLDAQNHVALTGKATELGCTENLEQAVLAWTEVVTRFPYDLTAWMSLGMTHKALKKFEAAINAFYKAIEINGSYVEAWYESGNCWAELKNIKNAIQCYNSVLNIDPQYEPAKKALSFWRKV